MKFEITTETIYSIIRTLDVYARAGDMKSGLPCHKYEMEEMSDLIKMILLDTNMQ